MLEVEEKIIKILDGVPSSSLVMLSLGSGHLPQNIVELVTVPFIPFCGQYTKYAKSPKAVPQVKWYLNAVWV